MGEGRGAYLVTAYWSYIQARGNIFSQLRRPSAKVRPGGRVRVKLYFCAFHPFLNSPQDSEYFEYRHIG